MAAFRGSDGSRLVKLIHSTDPWSLPRSARFPGIAKLAYLIWSNELPMEELTLDHLVLRYCRQIIMQAMDYVRGRMREENLPALKRQVQNVHIEKSRRSGLLSRVTHVLFSNLITCSASAGFLAATNGVRFGCLASLRKAMRISSRSSCDVMGFPCRSRIVRPVFRPM